MGAWQRYWFSPASLLDLAVGRICLATILLVLNGTSRFLIVARAPAELWRPLGIVELLSLPRPTLATMQDLAWVTTLLLILVGVGQFTRIALLALFPLLLVQETLLASVGKPTHATIPLLYAVLFFALSPCNDRLALDDLWRRGFRRGSDTLFTDESTFARWPIDLLYVVLAGFYFSAGVSKLLRSGFSWADGYTLQYHLLWASTPLGLWLAESPRVCGLASAAVLAWELSFPLGMIRRWRPLFLIGGVTFHLATWFCLNIGFWPVPALYLLFVPWSRWTSRRSSNPCLT